VPRRGNPLLRLRQGAPIPVALTAARADFYVLLGKEHELSVTVATRKKKEGIVVEAVYVDGVDVLRGEKDAWDIDGERFYIWASPRSLEQQLSEELVVPTRCLKVTYTPGDAATADELQFSRGWTVRKG
jgi:hypothetical protein